MDNYFGVVSYLRDINRILGLLDVETSSESAVPDHGHGRLDVLGVGLRETVLGGFLQSRHGGRLVDVLLTAGPPMEESRILEDPGVAMPDLEGHLVPGQGLLGEDGESGATDPGRGSDETLVDDFVVETHGFKNLPETFFINFKIARYSRSKQLGFHLPKVSFFIIELSCICDKRASIEILISKVLYLTSLCGATMQRKY